MQFIDLKSQYVLLKESIDSNIRNVLEHGQYIMGPEVFELEKNLAEYVSTKHCVSCSSGTDALVMALLAYGVGEGDVVVTTPFTFIATAEAIKFVGAEPLFVDIDMDTFNLSPTTLERTLDEIANGKLGIHSGVCSQVSDIKAIISVDLFGLPADAAAINRIAKKYNLTVIEDAAQGFGGAINSVKSGGLSDIGCTSFFPAKPLGGYGDGGAIFTNSDEVADALKSIRVHGQGSDKYQNVRLGLTGRLDTIQAAVLLEKLRIFDGELVKRQNVAESYTQRLSTLAGIETPRIPDGYVSAWAQYTLMATDEEHRNKIMSYLKEKGIPAAIYYPIPLNEQKVFSGLGYGASDFQVSSRASRRVFSLPMHPYLKEQEIEEICKFIEEV